MPSIGKLEHRVGAKMCILITGYILSLCTFLAAFANSVFTLCITFGFGVGLGMSAYYIPLYAAIRWLPERSDIAIGVIFSGFGLSSLLFGKIATQYVNPHDISVDESSDYFESDSTVANNVSQ